MSVITEQLETPAPTPTPPAADPVAAGNPNGTATNGTALGSALGPARGAPVTPAGAPASVHCRTHSLTDGVLLDRIMRAEPDVDAIAALRSLTEELRVNVLGTTGDPTQGIGGAVVVRVLARRGEVELHPGLGAGPADADAQAEIDAGARLRPNRDGTARLVFGPDADAPDATAPDDAETLALARAVLAKARHLARHGAHRPLAAFTAARGPNYDFDAAPTDDQLAQAQTRTNVRG